jgi:hypothetical protein
MDRCQTHARRLLAALPFFMLFIMVGSAGAQGLFGVGLPGLPSFGKGCGAADPCAAGGFPARADAKAGYGAIGLNFNLPIPAPFATTLDLSFRNANVAIGSVGASLESNMGLFLALRAAANAKRHIIVNTPESLFGPVTWDGQSMQWWMLDGYAGYRFTSCWSILGGLRRDKVTVGLTDPVDAAGDPLNFRVVVPGVVTVIGHNQGDLSSAIWIPYIGLQLAGQNYRANLLYSPFASADIKIPVVNFLGVFVVVPPATILVGTDLEFKVKDSTQFFEFNFEYDVSLSRNLSCQVWFTGNWMRLRSGGELDLISDIFITPPVPPLEVTTLVSGDGRATYTRSLLAGGISAVLSF